LFCDIQTAALVEGNVRCPENFMVGNKKIFDGQCFDCLGGVLGGGLAWNLRVKKLFFALIFIASAPERRSRGGGNPC
jgi:hypothetical protein